MTLRPPDFESGASASSATPALFIAKIWTGGGRPCTDVQGLHVECLMHSYVLGFLEFKSGPEGDRTHDLDNAIVALSQLSYRPTRY